MDKILIDLRKYIPEGANILTKRGYGKKVRNLIGLTKLDKDDNIYIFNFPSSIKLIANSFFLGMFDHSVMTLGDKRFLEKYKFKSVNDISKDVENGLKYIHIARGLDMDEDYKESLPKSCPFCGGTNIKYSLKSQQSGNDRHYYSAMYCNDCHAYGPRTLIKVNANDYEKQLEIEKSQLCIDQATELWNRRN